VYAIKLTAEFLRLLNTLYARGKFRAQQFRVGSLIREAPHSGKPHVDCAWWQLAAFEMNSMACNDGLVE